MSLKPSQQNESYQFRFLSNNVKGIHPSKKRLKQFDCFKIKLKPNRLLSLQETHSTTDWEKMWKGQFEGELHFSHGSSNFCGVLVAFYGNQDITVKK